MHPDELLCVEARAHRCGVEVRLNDIPLARVGDGHALHVVRPAHTVAIGGMNELVLRVVSVSPPAPGEAPGDPRARARLVRFRDGDDADSETHGTVVADVSWSAGEGAAEPVGAERRVTAHLGEGFGRWSWQDAPVLSITTSLLDELEATLLRWSALLTQADGDAFLAAHAVFLDEHLAAYPREDRRRFLAAQHRFATTLARAGGHVEVAPRERWAVRLAAGGRLLETLRDDGRPILELFEGDGARVPYAALFGRVNAELVLLRG